MAALRLSPSPSSLCCPYRDSWEKQVQFCPLLPVPHPVRSLTRGLGEATLSEGERAGRINQISMVSQMSHVCTCFPETHEEKNVRIGLLDCGSILMFPNMLRRKWLCFGIYAPAKGSFLNCESEHVHIQYREHGGEDHDELRGGSPRGARYCTRQCLRQWLHEWGFSLEGRGGPVPGSQHTETTGGKTKTGSADSGGDILC